MSAKKEKVLDDIARVAGGTVSVFSGLTQTIREDLKSRADDLGQRLDFVPREDFERLEALVHVQAERIETLEKSLNTKSKKK